MEENRVILEEEISSKLLVTFLQNAVKEEEKQGAKKEKEVNAAERKSYAVDLSSLLQHRFPKSHWETAITYFSQTCNK